MVVGPTAPRRTVWCEVEGAYPEPVELTTVAAAAVEGEIRARIAGVAAIAGDPVAEVWTEGDETWVRHESGTHRRYWNSPISVGSDNCHRESATVWPQSGICRILGEMTHA